MMTVPGAEATSTDLALQTIELSVGYRSRRVRQVVLDNLNLGVHPGELVCLLGPNGIGKSTLLRTLARMQPAMSGFIELGGCDLRRLNQMDLARRLGVVFDYRALAMFVGLVIGAAILVVRRARLWTLLAVGEAWAGTRGGDVRQLLRFGYIAGSFLAASTVALTGPIGFIGLVVPHLVRVRISADDRVLMPCTFFFGGVLLASCDAVGRVILAPAEVPAGAITACIGGPYLMWLLRRRVAR